MLLITLYLLESFAYLDLLWPKNIADLDREERFTLGGCFIIVVLLDSLSLVIYF